MDVVKSRISVKAQVMSKVPSVRLRVGKVGQYAYKIDILTSTDAYGIPFCIPGRASPTTFAVDNRSTSWKSRASSELRSWSCLGIRLANLCLLQNHVAYPDVKVREGQVRFNLNVEVMKKRRGLTKRILVHPTQRCIRRGI